MKKNRTTKSRPRRRRQREMMTGMFEPDEDDVKQLPELAYCAPDK